ncbi:hypothetical protein [Dictyobacter arantiisoli]
MRTGIPWNAMPRPIGGASTVYDRICLCLGTPGRV